MCSPHPDEYEPAAEKECSHEWLVTHHGLSGRGVSQLTGLSAANWLTGSD